MDRWKSRGGKSQGGEEKKVRRSEKRKREKKEDASVRKGRKVAIHCVCPMICGSRASNSRLAKAAGAEPAGQIRDEKLHAVVARSTFPSQKCQKPTGSDRPWKLRCRKSARRCGAKHISKSKCTKHAWFGPLLEVEMSKKCTPLWREAHFQVKSVNNWPVSEHFWKFWCQKSVRVARSTFPSQNVQSTPRSAHFWKLRCWKSARRCGAKHISESKWNTIHITFSALLEVQRLNKCTLLWHEEHFQVKSVKKWRARDTFGSGDVEKVCAVVARSTLPRKNVQNTPGADHFWKLKCSKSARSCGAKHISKSKVSKTDGLGPLLDGQMSFFLACARDSAPSEKWAKREGLWQFQLQPPIHYTRLHSTTLHYTPPHYTKLHYTTLQYIQ